MEINKILELKDKNTTPFYIFDYDILQERYQKLKKLSYQNMKLCYAIKANPFLVPALKKFDLLFEVCSPGELSICEKYKVDPSKIVFSGVCKTYEDVKRAYNLRVKTITLESKLHCSCLIEAVKNSETIHEQEVILRLTSGNQFGMSKDDLENCIKLLKDIPSIKIRGIHYFTGTQKKIKKITDEIVFITDFCSYLKEKYDLSFNDIEYGPGLSFDYFNLNGEENNYAEFESFVSLIKDSSFNFVVELGRYFASSCGTYVTRIMDIKSDNDKNYCIIDGGINHINYYGQMLGMKNPPVEHIKADGKSGADNSSDKALKYSICGSLCTTADVVLRELKLTAAETGDLLVFKNIGAYSITEGIYMFLSHPMPEVYIKNSGEIKKVRNQIETFEINS